ncbi:MAG: sulfotransferase [Pseudomonadota bacterium]
MISHPKVPNLFVIGAPKAGTTSLFQWLGDHPAVGKSTENELRYLMDRDDPLCRNDGFHTEGLEGYGRFYHNSLADSGIRYLIDVSPQYYYQDTAFSVISNMPDSHVIMLLRKPSKRIYSLYNYSKNNKVALQADMGFADFVDEVRRGDASDILRHRPMLRFAIKHSEYASYIRKWQSVVSRDRLHIYLFEDVFHDPRTMLCQIADDLGLSGAFYHSYGFPAQNQSYAVRNRRLHKALHRSRKRIPDWLRKSMKAAYLMVNTRKLDTSMPDADRDVLAQLDAEFVETEREIAEMLGRGTPIW